MIRFHWKWKSFIRSRFLIKLMDEAISWLVQQSQQGCFVGFSDWVQLEKISYYCYGQTISAKTRAQKDLKNIWEKQGFNFVWKTNSKIRKINPKSPLSQVEIDWKLWIFPIFPLSLWTKTTRQHRPRPSGGEQKFHVSRFNSITHNETTAGFTKEMKKYKKKFAS